jgi:putative cardiolipin synthase
MKRRSLVLVLVLCASSLAASVLSRGPAIADRAATQARSDFAGASARRMIPLAAVLLLCACASLPPLSGRPASRAIVDADTPLGRAVVPRAASMPGSSGVRALPDPLDAFAARMVLARAATRSLDVQYYIWRDDTTGQLMLDALREAAERGVRVRLLLDDNGIPGLDDALASLDALDGVEVRLFNPFANRRVRSLGYVTDFSRLNRRMHNKSLTADGVATIVGGRNVGDEYFGAGDGALFQDLDVLAVGPVAAEVSTAFDLYWNSESAYPIASLARPPDAKTRERLVRQLSEARRTPRATAYGEAVVRSPLLREIAEQRLSLEWVPVRLVTDDPGKALGKAAREDLLAQRLFAVIGPAKREIDLVSPYFVPGEKGTRSLVELARSGVRVRILTNSLSATDVTAVHAGYERRREALVRGGARLFELRRDILSLGDPASNPDRRLFGGSSAASLHAKTFAVDRERVFVGSFNFDPRSMSLNTELGVLIESPRLASVLSDRLDQRLPQVAYEVVPAARGSGIEWIERTNGREERLTSEPATGFFRRLGVGLMSILPIEWLL